MRAIITGATKGMGKAIVERFAAEGYDLITVARNKSELDQQAQQLLKMHKVNVETIAADVSDPVGMQFLISTIHAMKLDIDILVNNAGTYLAADILHEPDNALQQMLNINLFSAYNLTKGLLPTFIQQRKGHIFNICSVASLEPIPAAFSYSVSKFALYGFTKCLREELKDKGIKVTAIIPGSTLTASWDGTAIPKERFILPDDVASAILNAIQLSAGACIEEIILRPQEGTI